MWKPTVVVATTCTLKFVSVMFMYPLFNPNLGTNKGNLNCAK